MVGVWHTIRHVDGTWEPFGDVKSQAGNVGKFVDISGAGVAGDLPTSEFQMCGITSDGGVWHTIRHADGTWHAFGNVKGVAGDTGSFLGVSGTELFMTVTDAPIM